MRGSTERGFTLVEALVALGIVAMVVVGYIGIRTSALMDATQARNLRLAREIAEQKMSELQAGAREMAPTSGETVKLDDYEGFSFKIVIGESNVADAEAEVGNEAAGDNETATERLEWQRDREDFRRAQSRGLSRAEYDDQRLEDINQRLAEKAPSATEFEEVAVVVYFPKIGATYEGEEDTLLIKARLSTLAIRGYTPQEAQQEASTRGNSAAAAGLPGGAAPAGGSASGSGAAGSSGASGRSGNSGGSTTSAGTGK